MKKLKNSKILTEQEKDNLLQTLKNKFNINIKLHQNIIREDIFIGLNNQPEKLWSLQ